MLTFLLVITATFHPAKPTVGDRITVDFANSVVLERSASYEVLSERGGRVVVRTFEPRPFALSGVTGGVHFRNLVVPARPVLAPEDSMQPAPLKPPRKTPWPRAPLIAIGAAAAAAALAWAALYAVHAWWTRSAREAVIVPPAERFRMTVSALLDRPAAAGRWAALANAARAYLDARGFGSDLTTSQILAELDGHELIADVLRRGDLEKFSPWGAPPGDFTTVARRALELPEQFEPKPEAAAA